MLNYHCESFGKLTFWALALCQLLWWNYILFHQSDLTELKSMIMIFVQLTWEFYDSSYVALSTSLVCFSDAKSNFVTLIVFFFSDNIDRSNSAILSKSIKACFNLVLKQRCCAVGLMAFNSARHNCLSRAMLHDMKAITTSQKNPAILVLVMQQRSFREFRVENEGKKKNRHWKTACG